MMLEGQNSLPRLPIASLDDAIEDFLRATEPLLSGPEFGRTKQLAQEFLENEGPALHKLLVEYDEHEGRNSFLEDFWEDAYLAQRSSIAINTNPFFTLEDDPTPARTSQIARATTLVWSSLLFCQSVRAKKLEPDVQRTTPLCMCQYTKLFGTARIPMPARDKTVFCEDSRHIVVMSRGLIYAFDVLDAHMELSISRDRLAETLRAIREDSGLVGPEERMHNAVGVLTSEDRDVWARWRAELAKDPANAECLQLVDASLFVLCLDDTAPPSPADMARVALHGTSGACRQHGCVHACVRACMCVCTWGCAHGCCNARGRAVRISEVQSGGADETRCGTAVANRIGLTRGAARCSGGLFARISGRAARHVRQPLVRLYIYLCIHLSLCIYIARHVRQPLVRLVSCAAYRVTHAHVHAYVFTHACTHRCTHALHPQVRQIASDHRVSKRRGRRQLRAFRHRWTHRSQVYVVYVI